MHLRWGPESVFPQRFDNTTDRSENILADMTVAFNLQYPDCHKSILSITNKSITNKMVSRNTSNVLAKLC